MPVVDLKLYPVCFVVRFVVFRNTLGAGRRLRFKIRQYGDGRFRVDLMTLAKLKHSNGGIELEFERQGFGVNQWIAKLNENFFTPEISLCKTIAKLCLWDIITFLPPVGSAS